MTTAARSASRGCPANDDASRTGGTRTGRMLRVGGRQQAAAPRMRGRVQLTGREATNPYGRFQAVVVTVGAPAFDQRDPAEHRAVGRRVVDAARPRARRARRRATPRATGSSTRGTGRRCARRVRSVSPSSPASIALAMRSRSGQDDRLGRASRAMDASAGTTSAPTAARPAPYASSIASCSRSTQAVNSSGSGTSTCSRGGPALVPPHRVEQRVLVVLRGALRPAWWSRRSAGRAPRTAASATRRRSLRFRRSAPTGSVFGGSARPARLRRLGRSFGLGRRVGATAASIGPASATSTMR